MSTIPQGLLSRSQIHEVFARHDVGLDPEAALQEAARLARATAVDAFRSDRERAMQRLGDLDDLLISLEAIAPKLTDQPNIGDDHVSILIVSALCKFARELVGEIHATIEGPIGVSR